MSSFVVELWESIFVPGPTPTILRATNASFAALQVTLLALLVATYSYHFAILSVLSAGLWWSINWFATELAAAKARGDIPSGDNADDGAAAADKANVAGSGKTATGAEDDGGEDTEVEGQGQKLPKPKKGSRGGKKGGDAGVAAPSADVEAVEKTGDLKQRLVSMSASQSSVSTEDEWEKVSETENDKSQ